MRRLLIALTLAATSVAAGAQTNPCANISLGMNGNLNGFTMFPNDAWHQDISAAPVDPGSATWISGHADNMHPDFDTPAVIVAGIPYYVVDSTNSTPQPISKWVVNNGAGQPIYPTGASDDTLYPIPNNHALVIEGEPAASDTDPNTNTAATDQHALILDKGNCVLYEAWKMQQRTDGTYTMTNGAIWDLKQSSQQRAWDTTSADAGGFSVLEGLVNYDEAASGTINHAIRFTMSDMNSSPVFYTPAMHYSAGGGGASVTGMRLRLKSTFDVSSYPAEDQAILNAMKKYGLILADGGSNFYVSGVMDSRWNDADLNLLKNVTMSNFDMVTLGTEYNENSPPTLTVPTGTITASATKVAQGNPVTLSITSTGDNNYIDNAGWLRAPGSITVTPTATTTYTLYSALSGQDKHSVPLGSVTVEVNPTSATFTPGSVQALANTSIPLSVTCNFSDGSVLPCPATFSASAGTVTGSTISAPVGTSTITTTYGGLTLTNTLTFVPSPPKWGGHVVASGHH